MHNLALASFALLVLAAGTAAAGDRSCRDKPVPPLIEGPASVVDGDTIAFPGQPRVRLWGIQAPELRDKATGQETPAGMAARVALAKRLGIALDVGERCRPVKWDRWCRLVATCEGLVFGREEPTYDDLGAAMLRDGMAYTFMLDDPLHGREAEGLALARDYTHLERTARKQRVGLWKIWMPE